MCFIIKVAILIFLTKCVNTQILNANCGSKVLEEKELTYEFLQKIIPSTRTATIININFPNCNVVRIHSSAFGNYTEINEIRLNENVIQDIIVGTFDKNINLNILILNDNILKKLKQGTFANQINLKKLYLQNNKIDYIQKDVFSNMQSLETLNLANNKLENLYKFIFLYNKNLTYLNIASNSISYLGNSIFSSLTRLEKLYLNNNKIMHIHNILFANLGSLVQLELSNNLISNLEPDVFDNIKLEYLWMDENSIENGNEKLQNKIKHLTFISDSKVEKTVLYFTGDIVNLSCHVEDSITLNEVYWLKNEGRESLSKRFLITTKEDRKGGLLCNLTIYNITKTDEGVYKCISDEESPSKTYYKLNVLDMPSNEKEEKQDSNAYIAIVCIVCLAILIIFVIIYKMYRKCKMADSNVQSHNFNPPTQLTELQNQPTNETEDQYSYAYVQPNEVTNAEGNHPLTARNFSLLERKANQQ